MVAVAHRHGACVLVDGALPVNVQALDCDFYVFSGHKVFAPTGIGVLYGKPEVLASMPPWQGGGNMIADVTFEKTIYQAPPLRFEAGTGNIADAVGLGAAIDYLDRIGMANIASDEHGLLDTATQGLLDVPGLTIIGTAKEKAGDSCSMAAAARMSAPRSTEKAPRSALATIACSRSCAGSG
jgi:cysteine desulfurase / selenocysteine lyase